MEVFSVFDEKFAEYGKVLKGYDTTALVAAMNEIPMPDGGVNYEPWIDSLEATDIFTPIQENIFGGMPIELGMCWGYNKALNCLEYHRNSEINIGASEFILLLAKMSDVKEGVIDSSTVVAFKAPAGAVVQVYETSLHYAPCQTADDGFRVAVVLPRNTNTDLDAKPAMIDDEDKLLWARNKWLIAHADSSEAKQGAFIGITGENLTV